jgi:16S rRNA U1498 N3-methylase RsmE
VTLTEWEYQLFLTENQSDSRKKGKQSGNKIRHLLTTRRIKEKDAMVATNDT